MRSTISRSLPVLAGVAAIAAIALARGGPAQSPSEARPDPDNLILIYPTGDRATSSLLVEAVAPAEARVGQEFEYQIRVTNLTKNLVLQDLRVTQELHEGLSVVGSSLDGQAAGKQAEGAADRTKDTSKRDTKDASKRDAASGEKADEKPKAGEKPKADEKSKADAKTAGNDGHHAAGRSARADSSEDRSPSWGLDRLGPGESRTIAIRAIGDQEGVAASCIRVKYEPTLCLATRIVKPEVQLTKQAPELADLCQPLSFRYTIANVGTGVARGLTIQDELPEGLAVDGGGRGVRIDVGDLPAGQERSFDVRAEAAQVGEFTSRAVARGAGDLQAASRETTTLVDRAELALELEGPEVRHVDQPSTYRAVVHNRGRVAAIGAQLRVEVDPQSRVIRMSKSAPDDVVPTSETSLLTWDFGEIEPDGRRAVSFTAIGRGDGQFQHTATASSVCAAAGEREVEVVSREIVTEVLTIPALRLYMVDHVDPVKVGEEEIYTINVLNQGNGPDHDIRTVITLPEVFEFVSATGPGGQARADGQEIVLGTVDVLEPKEEVEWQIRARAKEAGDTRARVELSSRYLDDPVPSVEPTRVLEP